LVTLPKKIEGLIVRDRIPLGDGPHPVVLMLHGWTGSEQSMWVFASRFPKNTLLIAPRGIYPSPLGGYSWSVTTDVRMSLLEDFQTAIHSLLALVTTSHYPTALNDKFSLVGFSQGAALSYAIALTAPERVQAVAGLSGYLPQGVESAISQKPLDGIPCFIAHGTQDDLVPVAFARKSVSLLKKAGAQVSYCESDVGHKLGASCFSGLESFFRL
jgi:phospholipase/carboxylesterase